MGWRTYLGTAAVTLGGFSLLTGSAFATPIGDCSTVSSIPATPAAGTRAP